MSAPDFPAEATFFAKPLPHARPFAFLLGADDSSAAVGLDLNGARRLCAEGGHDHGGLTTASFVDLDLDLNCPATTPTDTNTPPPSPSSSSSLFCSPGLASPATPLSSPFGVPGFYTPMSSPYQSPYAALCTLSPAAAPMTAEAETTMAALNALRLELERERARMEAERRELQQARETVRQGEAALAADRARLGEQQQHLGAELERLAEKRVQLRAEKRAFRFMQREWERQVDARVLQAQGHTSDQPIVLADDDDDGDDDVDKADDKVDKAPQAAVETKRRRVVVVDDDDEHEAAANAAEPPKPRRIAKRKNKPQASAISEEQTPAPAKKAKRADSSIGGGDDGGSGGGDGAKGTQQGLDVEAGSHKLADQKVVDERELFTLVTDEDDDEEEEQEEEKNNDAADESEGVTATQDSPWSSPQAPVPPVVEAEEKALRSGPAEAKPSSEAVAVVAVSPQNESEAEAKAKAEAEDSRIGRAPNDEATDAAEPAVARVEETMMRDVTAALPPERVSDARPDQMAGGADMASEKPGHDDEEEEEDEDSAQLLKCRECCTTETTTWMRGPAGPCTLCDSCGHRFQKEEDARERARIERRQALAARKKKRKTLVDKQPPARTQKKRLSPKATTAASDQEEDAPVIGKYATGVRNEAAASRVRRTNERLGASIPSYPHPASLGPIDGVDIGDWFPNRIITSKSGVHRPWVSGIHGTAKTGCYSIVLNGGYEDDDDHGTTFLYTGSGGRDLSGNKRTAPQTSDQPLNNNNASLVKSCDDHTPVRVVRGKRSGAYAPTEGYRYDGLYYVTRYWQEPGQSGFKVWRFKFKYGQDQTPPWEMEGYREHRERWDTKHGLTQLSDDESEDSEDSDGSSTSSSSSSSSSESSLDDSHSRGGGKRRVKLEEEEEEEEEERDAGGHGHKKEEERAGHRAKRAKVKAETSAKTTKKEKRKVVEAHSAADKENAKNGSTKRAA